MPSRSYTFRGFFFRVGIFLKLKFICILCDQFIYVNGTLFSLFQSCFYPIVVPYMYVYANPVNSDLIEDLHTSVIPSKVFLSDGDGEE